MSDVTANYGTLLDFVAFLLFFIHNWQVFMSEVLYLHKTFKYWLIDIIWYINMPNVTAGYGRFSDKIVLFGNFHILLLLVKVFIKLLLIVSGVLWLLELGTRIFKFGVPVNFRRPSCIIFSKMQFFSEKNLEIVFFVFWNGFQPFLVYSLKKAI